MGARAGTFLNRVAVFATACTTLLASHASAQPVQNPELPSEAEAARMELRAMLDAWADAAGVEIADEAFDRWYTTLEPELERQLQDPDSIEPDCGIDRPVFDDQWWPARLAEAGVPRPAKFDERAREPWEWAGEMQRLVWQAQQPAPLATDRWPAVMTLVDTYAHAHAAELARLEERFDLDGDVKWAVQWLLQRGKLAGDDLAAIDAYPQRDEVLTAIAEALLRLDERLNLPANELLTPIESPVHLVPISGVTISAGLVPNLSPSRQLGGYLEGRMRTALDEGRYADASKDATLAIELAHAYARVPSMLASMVAWGEAQDVMLALTEGLGGRQVDAATLRALDAVLDCFQPLAPSYAMRGEAIVCYGSLDEFYRHVHATVPRSDSLRQSFVELTSMVGLGSSRGVQMAIMTEVYEAHALRLDKIASTVGIDEEHGRALLVLDWVYSEEGMDECECRAPVLWLTLPAVGAYRDKHEGMVLLRHAVATMFAIELYRAENGELPQALGDLPDHARRFVGDLYVDVRDDPPLGYVVTDAQATGFGVGYVLYGFGRDGEDNGGVKHTNMNYGARAHPRRLKGTDFVFNPPGRSPDPGP